VYLTILCKFRVHQDSGIENSKLKVVGKRRTLDHGAVREGTLLSVMKAFGTCDLIMKTVEMSVEHGMSREFYLGASRTEYFTSYTLRLAEDSHSKCTKKKRARVRLPFIRNLQ
jgi:hypothetical protein